MVRFVFLSENLTIKSFFDETFLLELFSSSFQHHFHFLWHWAITMSPVEWMTCTASAQMHSPFSSVSLLINSIWQSIGQLCVCGYQSNQYDRTHSFSLLQMRERVHLRMSTELRVLELANAANWLEVIGSSGKLVSFSASMISRFLSLSLPKAPWYIKP